MRRTAPAFHFSLPDGDCLFLVQYKVPVRAAVVAEEPRKRNCDLSAGEPLSLSPGAVLRDGAAFFLRQRGHDNDEKFTLTVQRPDVLFFKVYLDAFLFQFPNRCDTVDRVPGEAADRLCNDEVDFACQRIRHHALEALAVLRVGAGDALVGVDLHELPIVPPFDVGGVVVNLGGVAGLLFLAVRGNTSIGGGAAFFLLVNRRCRVSADRRRNAAYL